MNQTVSIRQATPEDAASVAALMTGLNLVVGVSGIPEPEAMLPEHAIFTAELTGRRMQAMSSVEEVFLAAIEGNDVGFMSLRLVPYLDQDVPYAEVMNLYVRPEAQRRGVASALVARAEAVARDRGATVMRILTGADNHGAQAFYRAAGYEIPNVSCEKFLIGAAANG